MHGVPRNANVAEGETRPYRDVRSVSSRMKDGGYWETACRVATQWDLPAPPSPWRYMTSSLPGRRKAVLRSLASRTSAELVRVQSELQQQMDLELATRMNAQAEEQNAILAKNLADAFAELHRR